MYEITEQRKPTIKRKLDDAFNEIAPPMKKSSKSKPTKRPLSDDAIKSHSKKTACIPSTSSSSHGEECVITAVHRSAVPQTEWKDYRYYPIDTEWQRQKCTQLGLPFVKVFNRQDGRPDLVLTRPDLRSIKKIR